MPVLAYGKNYSASGALRAMVEERPLLHGAAALDGALKLAATYAQLLDHLAADLGPMPEPGRKIFNRSLEKGAFEALPEQLVFAASPATGWRPAFRTQAFLSALPTDFVTELVHLAPPVVAPIPRDPTRFALLGNVLSGLLAIRCLAGEAIPMRRLKKATGPRWTPTDLVAWALPGLESVVKTHRRRIARIAPDLDVATLIIGTSRATAARYRPGRESAAGIQR